jgi:hypothetical protein
MSMNHNDEEHLIDMYEDLISYGLSKSSAHSIASRNDIETLSQIKKEIAEEKNKSRKRK